jgi:hypothetical protein
VRVLVVDDGAVCQDPIGHSDGFKVVPAGDGRSARSAPAGFPPAACRVLAHRVMPTGRDERTGA